LNDRFDSKGNILNPRSMEHDREMQLLKNMESVHSRKKAAFNELLRYTYSNLKDVKNNDSDNNNS